MTMWGKFIRRRQLIGMQLERIPTDDGRRDYGSVVDTDNIGPHPPVASRPGRGRAVALRGRHLGRCATEGLADANAAFQDVRRSVESGAAHVSFRRDDGPRPRGATSGTGRSDKADRARGCFAWRERDVEMAW